MNLVLKAALGLVLAIAVPLAVVVLLPVHDLTARVLVALVVPVWVLADAVAQKRRRVVVRNDRLRELAS